MGEFGGVRKQLLKNISFVLLALFLSTSVVIAQKMEGQVVDQKTGEPLAYVNIGVVELGVGTVSDKYGNFSLKFNKGKADSVLFSAIGYKQRNISVEYLLDNPKVSLSPTSYELKSFDVTGKTKGRDKTFGVKKGFPAGQTNLASNEPGDEIGTPIKIRTPTYLKSANFTIVRISGDSMIYRVNIYEFNNGKVGENLLTEDVLLTGAQKEGVVSIDLTPYELVVADDVLLALENIAVDNHEVKRGVSFRYKSIFLRDRNVYGRIGENSKNVGGTFSKIIDGAALNFFFVGRKL